MDPAAFVLLGSLTSVPKLFVHGNARLVYLTPPERREILQGPALLSSRGCVIFSAVVAILLREREDSTQPF